MIRLRDLLLRWLLVPTLVLWALAFGFSYLRSLAQAHEAYDRTLLGSALVLGENLQVAGGDVVADLPFAALEMLRTDAQDRIFYRVAELAGGAAGGELGHITGYEGLPPPPPGWGPEPVFYDAAYQGQDVRIVALRQPLLDGSRRRELLVQVAETLEARHHLTRRMVVDSALVQLVLIASAAGLIVLGVRKGLMPLKRLRSEVRARGPNDLTPIAADAVPREVAPLIQAINAHTARQRQLSDAQLRFVANASHQLKTPLTLLRAQIGQALQQTDLDAMRTMVTRLDGATEATGRVVTQLLALARSEAGAAFELQDIELGALAHEVTFELLHSARQKGIDLGLEVSGKASGTASREAHGEARGEANGEANGSVTVRGEPVLLRELLTNLVHNAVTYTQAGGQVTVAVDAWQNQARLRVLDNGPGIPVHERERAFERFYRGTETAQPGSGLGLAIAREICLRHGITITLVDASPEHSGLCVTLLWPDPSPV